MKSQKKRTVNEAVSEVEFKAQINNGRKKEHCGWLIETVESEKGEKVVSKRKSEQTFQNDFFSPAFLCVVCFVQWWNVNQLIEYRKHQKQMTIHSIE